MATSPAYGNIISARSRRLRTIGMVLIGAILAMVLYGMTSFMPTLRHTKDDLQRLNGGKPISIFREKAKTPDEERLRKALAAQLVFAYGYWAVCGILVLSAVFVAYLDFREVTRNYIAQRRAVWTEMADANRKES